MYAQRQINWFAVLRFLIAILCVIWFLLDANDVFAQNKPSILTQNTGDTSEVDQAISKTYDVATFIAYGAGVLTFVVGAILLSPLLGGSSQKGKYFMGTGLAIILITAFSGTIVGFFANLF